MALEGVDGGSRISTFTREKDSRQLIGNGANDMIVIEESGEDGNQGHVPTVVVSHLHDYNEGVQRKVITSCETFIVFLSSVTLRQHRRSL